MSTGTSTTTPSSPGSPSKTSTTMSEMVESLNGYDELAIAKYFDGLDLYDIDEAGNAKAGGSAMLRALIFVQLRRGYSDTSVTGHDPVDMPGVTDKTAYNTVMLLRMGDLTAWFAAEEPPQLVETPDGFADVSPAGEGLGGAETPPASALPGASTPANPGTSTPS